MAVYGIALTPLLKYLTTCYPERDPVIPSLLERTNICNFADDNTIYRCDSVLEIMLDNLQHYMKILLN